MLRSYLNSGAPDRVVGRVGGTVQRRGCDTLQEV